jgi:hypothetical protein
MSNSSHTRYKLHFQWFLEAAFMAEQVFRESFQDKEVIPKKAGNEEGTSLHFSL